ncbi:class D sortase [Paenibacillus sepulcri]|uniref:class D sortase n=1 Tax=Paenibacillus sepulcri TaxID=359917 RepID=UPI0035EAFA2B
MDHNTFASAAEKSDRLLAESYQRLSDLFSNEADAAVPEAVSDDQSMEDPQGIAVIEIGSIDVKLPVLEGATTQNMKYAAVHLTETAALGDIGNAALAAHRAHTKGRLFNRLGEVKMGDKITIRVKDKVMAYTVFKISVVKPTDLSVLNGNDTDRRSRLSHAIRLLIRPIV